MKILILSDGIPPFVMGGMQKHTLNLAKFLSLSGHQVHLMHCVYHNQEIPVEKDIIKAVFDTNESPSGFSQTCLHFPPPGKIPGHYIRASKLYSNLLYNEVKDELDSFDFIYIQGFVGDEFYKRKNELKAKLGVNFHGFEMFQKQANFKSTLQSKLLKKTVISHVQTADYSFSLGGKLTDIIHSLGVEKNNIIDIPNAIDSNWLENNIEEDTSSKRLDILFVGRYERRKGIEELTEAIKEIVKTEENIFFNFVGPIPTENQVNHRQVVYHGKIMDTDKIKSIYQNNDVLISPSYSEGMPTVILEAMSQNCAILATDVGANQLMINKNTGWLLASPESKEIIKKIKEISSLEKVTLESKKTASRKLISENFQWTNIIERTNKFLESVK